MTLFHEPKLIQWVHAPGFRGLVGLSTSKKGIMDKGATKNVVAVQTIQVVQNEDEVDSLKFFKEHKQVFAQSEIIGSY